MALKVLFALFLGLIEFALALSLGQEIDRTPASATDQLSVEKEVFYKLHYCVELHGGESTKLSLCADKYLSPRLTQDQRQKIYDWYKSDLEIQALQSCKKSSSVKVKGNEVALCYTGLKGTDKVYGHLIFEKSKKQVLLKSVR